jgi:hypothetical protein
MRKSTILKKFNRILNALNNNRSKLDLPNIQNIDKIEDDTRKLITIHAIASERKRRRETK